MVVRSSSEAVYCSAVVLGVQVYCPIRPQKRNHSLIGSSTFVDWKLNPGNLENHQQLSLFLETAAVAMIVLFVRLNLCRAPR